MASGAGIGCGTDAERATQQFFAAHEHLARLGEEFVVAGPAATVICAQASANPKSKAKKNFARGKFAQLIESENRNFKF